MIPLIALLSCAEPITATDVPTTPTQAIQPLPGPQLLRRLSLDLRGVLPSRAEQDAIAENPEAWETLREQYLEDPLFEERMVQVFADRWRTRVDVFDIVYQDFNMDPSEEFELEKSIGEEPLRLLARIAASDRPWTDIVTTEMTMANEVLGEIWPVQYPEDAKGWVESTYTDARPPAGVLTTNGLWWRYTTTNGNMNRGRAAAIARLLLCEDYMARPISLADQDEALDLSASAIQSNPYCMSCHSSLDPIAASLFGFWWMALYSPPEEIRYHPEREPLGPVYLNTEPAWYGAPMSGLADLGWQVATDSRFYSCAVESMAESLWQRPIELDDMALLDDIRRDFIEDGTRMKDLIRALTDTPAYQAGRLNSDAEENTRRLMSTSQLQTALDDLTGFQWTSQGYDQLANDTLGYRVLGGGTDGVTVVNKQRTPGLTWLLVFKRAAQGAASRAVTEDLEGQKRQLFRHVDLQTRPLDEAFTKELQSLHWQLLGMPLQQSTQAELEQLWSDVEAQEGAASAWQAVLTVLFRDPYFLSY